HVKIIFDNNENRLYCQLSILKDIMHMMELYPYQREGVNFLKNRKFAMLWDEPGLGKSAQAVRAWFELDINSILVICPASVRSVWEREIRQWDGTKRVIFLYSYEGAVKNVNLLKN